jgi:hypothetical protein
MCVVMLRRLMRELPIPAGNQALIRFFNEYYFCFPEQRDPAVRLFAC